MKIKNFSRLFLKCPFIMPSYGKEIDKNVYILMYNKVILIFSPIHFGSFVSAKQTVKSM